MTTGEVLGARIRQPKRAMEGMFGGLVGNTIGSDAVGADSLPAGPGVGALGAGRVAAGAQWVARWTLVALTPPTVVRLFVRSAFKLNVLHPDAFAEVECPPVRATAHPFATAAARYVLAEAATGRDYRLECARFDDR